MKGKILITDSLFIYADHEKRLEKAGYEIERLDKSQATEIELVEAIKGKAGYILGGAEKVTDKIIDTADSLKAIVFTGIGYKDFIPNYEYVTKKEIAIANTPDGPTHAVAEWAITMALAMNRNIFDLGRVGDKQFMTSKGIEGQKIAIIGLGRIGKKIAEMIQNFRPHSISYHSKHKHDDSKIKYKNLEDLLQTSDIIFLCVSKDAGENFISERELALIQNDALLITFVPNGIVNQNALLKELQNGRLRAASDHPMENIDSQKLPLYNWYCFNSSNAFNTINELKLTSDMATESMINLLETGEDNNKVN